jgi:hypothetical protein
VSVDDPSIISHLKPAEIVDIFGSDCLESWFETTARTLVKAGYGGLMFKYHPEADQYSVTVSDTAFDKMEAALCGSKAPHVGKRNRGRPRLPADERASGQIQLRVSAKRKTAYSLMAKNWEMSLSEWMFSVCDKASGFRAKS